MPDNEFQDVHDALGIQPTEGLDVSGVGYVPTTTGPSNIPAQILGSYAGGIENLLAGPGRAYSGQMTPEEQYKWGPEMALSMLSGGAPKGAAGIGAAKLAAPDVALPALKQVYEDAWKAGKGPMSSVADYLADKGIDFPHTAAQMHAGALQADDAELVEKYGHWASSKSDDFGEVHEALNLKPIDEDAIEKALAKNPGASLMDIAGVHTGEPSSTYAAPKGANPLALSTFPSEVPFQPPPKAQELGFTQPAVHGTRGSFWEGSEDQLKLPDEQLGVHFGNPRQAAVFSTARAISPGEINYYEQPRSYPVVLRIQNPIELPDSGTWRAQNIIDSLHNINNGVSYKTTGDFGTNSYKREQISPELQGQFPLHELDKLNSIDDVRDYLNSKGFDSVKYMNTVEDPGKTSYILYNESPTKRGYVTGARSPFAQFDPSKLHLPSLAAGMGGIVAYPFVPGSNKSEDSPNAQ